MFTTKLTWKALGLLICFSMMNIAFAKEVTLNMKGADINAVISSVAEATGKNFIVDPRVKGKVTIISSKSMKQSELFQVFLAILDVHNFAAIPVGNNIFKIVPDSEAKQSSTPDNGSGEEIVTQVVEVKHISAAQLVPILRPLVPPQGHLAAHAQTNVLIISDRASNVNRLVKIIAKLDEPSGNEIEVIPLQHASASEVVRVLTNLLRNEQKGGRNSNNLNLVADERTNSILLGGDKSDRLSIKALIIHLDTPSETVGNTHVIYLHYAKASDLVKVLTGVGKVTIQGKQQGRGRSPVSNAGKNFDIQADDSSNTLVITAAPDIFRSLQQVIRKLDIRRAQVLVEAIIAELAANNTNELGIQWFADGSQSGLGPVGVTNLGSPGITSLGALTGASQAISSGSLSSTTTATSSLSSVLGAGLTLGLGHFNSKTFNFGMLLRALAGASGANLLSTPNIVTMDNEQAEIFVGQEVSVPTGSFTQTNTSTSNPFTTYQPKQVGIRLKVKPQINAGDAIKLDIEQTVDAITAGSAGTANLVTSKRSIKTSIMVDDGQIVVLGGLIGNDETTTVQKVPLLGDIPLLGALFRYKSTIKDKKNLMVFIHPSILRDAVETANISSAKYSAMREAQIYRRGLSNSVEQAKKDLKPLMPRFEEISKPPVKKKEKQKQPEVDPDIFND